MLAFVQINEIDQDIELIASGLSGSVSISSEIRANAAS